MLVDGTQSELRSGLIGTSIEDANLAELASVRYALRSFIRSKLIVPHDTIMVHCDNDAVCRYLQDGITPPRKDFRDELATLQFAAAEASIIVCAMWVKGHRGPKANCWRELINCRVDIEARQVSRAENKRRERA